jgi:hypothetical protein
MKYKDYLKKHKNEVRTLNVWDIDDTLGNTSAKVNVMKDGKVIKVLSPGEYNTYKLNSGETMDFAEFRSGKIFRNTFKPINAVLNRAKSIVWNQSENSHSIILTARADFEDRDEFLQAWRDHGFPIDHVYVERSGNLSKLKKNSTAHVNKGVILRKYFASGKWDRVRMWDDHEKNLDMFLKIASMYPKVEAIAYLVKDGRVSRYGAVNTKKAVSESIRSAVKSTLKKQIYEH